MQRRCRQARCPDEEVYWKQDPRLGTRFPHAGDSEAALLRRALMSQRNQIEAMFSSLQSLGLGADGVHACKWARDRGMEWLISLALYARTARVLVHVNGMYDRMLEAGGDVYAKGATPTDADRARVRELKADGQNVDLEGDLELLNPTREESDDMGQNPADTTPLPRPRSPDRGLVRARTQRFLRQRARENLP